MKFYIKHEAKEYLRVRMDQASMTGRQADILQYYLQSQPQVIQAKVYERTAAATITYVGDRAEMIQILKKFRYEQTSVPEVFLENSGRDLNQEYKRKLWCKKFSAVWVAACSFQILYGLCSSG